MRRVAAAMIRSGMRLRPNINTITHINTHTYRDTCIYIYVYIKRGKINGENFSSICRSTDRLPRVLSTNRVRILCYSYYARTHLCRTTNGDNDNNKNKSTTTMTTTRRCQSRVPSATVSDTICKHTRRTWENRRGETAPNRGNDRPHDT